MNTNNAAITKNESEDKEQNKDDENDDEEFLLYVMADPYKWPFDGKLSPHNTCLLVIDMQVDYCCCPSDNKSGGGGGSYEDDDDDDDVSSTIITLKEPIHSIVESISNVLETFREKLYPIIYTREGYLPSLVDCPPTKLWRSKQQPIGGDGYGRSFLIQGEAGWEIIPQLKPLRTEIIVDKSTKGAFVGTNLDMILRHKGIRNLILVGVSTDGSVSTTQRYANDLGYECLLLEDCCACPSSAPFNHDATINIMKQQQGGSGSIIGCVSNSEELIQTIRGVEESELL